MSSMCQKAVSSAEPSEYLSPILNAAFADPCNLSRHTANLFLDCPVWRFEVSDHRISKHVSFREGLFGYTSTRSRSISPLLPDLDGFRHWNLARSDFNKPKHGEIVAD